MAKRVHKGPPPPTNFTRHYAPCIHCEDRERYSVRIRHYTFPGNFTDTPPDANYMADDHPIFQAALLAEQAGETATNTDSDRVVTVGILWYQQDST